jgi:magnesium transporter
MIRAYWRPKERIIEAGLEALKSKKVVWVDCCNPAPEDLAMISDVTGVSVNDLREHIVDYERPNAFEFDEYSLIVIGVPVMGENEIIMTSLAIFLFRNKNIVTIRTREIDGLDRYRSELLLKNPKYFESSTKVVRSIIERIVLDYFRYFDAFQEQADEIETRLFKKDRRHLVEDIFNLRKSLMKFHKTLIANKEVITAIEKAYLTKLSKEEIYDFRDIYNDIVQLVDTEETMRDTLTSLVDIYMSTSSHSVNKIIKKLTVVASYVLIPTLIASIYGMNFRHFPEIDWWFGYPFALGLMGLSIILVYHYFKRERLL